jgi:cyclopropane-fatty-acyl-phospholipid synthase
MSETEWTSNIAPMETDLSGDNRPLSLGSRATFAIARKIAHGAFTITTPEGATRRFSGGKPGPDGPLILNNTKLARRMILGGNVGLGESYIDGDWDSPRLADFLTVGALNYQALDDTLNGSAVYRAINRVIHHGKNANSKRGSRRNIAFHYDLGNTFYERWLDPSMTYSSAQFDDNATELETAQARKYDLLADRLDLKPDETVLEIGCGWGGFAERVAKERGAKVTGITISREQHDYAKARMQREGLNEKVDIRLVDYRDLEGRFDRIASIEMFEAVGEKYWPVFFDTLRERLVVGGRAALQIITIGDRHFDNYRRRPDFIQRYIFPGGMLPSETALREQIARAGLTQVSSEGFGQSYARTLAEWNTRFQEAWTDIREMGFDTRFKRMWEYYLAYCEAGFRAGNIDVRRIAIAKS